MRNIEMRICDPTNKTFRNTLRWLVVVVGCFSVYLDKILFNRRRVSECELHLARARV